MRVPGRARPHAAPTTTISGSRTHAGNSGFISRGGRVRTNIAMATQQQLMASTRRSLSLRLNKASARGPATSAPTCVRANEPSPLRAEHDCECTLSHTPHINTHTSPPNNCTTCEHWPCKKRNSHTKCVSSSGTNCFGF